MPLLATNPGVATASLLDSSMPHQLGGVLLERKKAFIRLSISPGHHKASVLFNQILKLCAMADKQIFDFDEILDNPDHV